MAIKMPAAIAPATIVRMIQVRSFIVESNRNAICKRPPIRIMLFRICELLEINCSVSSNSKDIDD